MCVLLLLPVDELDDAQGDEVAELHGVVPEHLDVILLQLDLSFLDHYQGPSYPALVGAHPCFSADGELVESCVDIFADLPVSPHGSDLFDQLCDLGVVADELAVDEDLALGSLLDVG